MQTLANEDTVEQIVFWMGSGQGRLPWDGSPHWTFLTVKWRLDLGTLFLRKSWFHTVKRMRFLSVRTIPRLRPQAKEIVFKSDLMRHFQIWGAWRGQPFRSRDMDRSWKRLLRNCKYCRWFTRKDCNFLNSIVSLKSSKKNWCSFCTFSQERFCVQNIFVFIWLHEIFVHEPAFVTSVDTRLRVLLYCVKELRCNFLFSTSGQILFNFLIWLSEFHRISNFKRSGKIRKARCAWARPLSNEYIRHTTSQTNSTQNTLGFNI